MSMIRKAIAVLCLLWVGFTLAAQNAVVSGTVTDQSGEPVIGAGVIVRGDLKRGAITDLSGQYSPAWAMLQ